MQSGRKNNFVYTAVDRFSLISDSLEASINPSTGVNVGDNINLTCTLIYNAPPSGAGAPFPLADNQDPELTMYIGHNAITTAELLVNTDTEPHSKSIVSNDLYEGEL